MGNGAYTSPTHVVAAFSKAIDELIAEGGISARFLVTKTIIKFYERDLQKSDSILILQRTNNHRLLQLFFFQMNNSILRISIICEGERICPLSRKANRNAETFRIGNIGEIYEEDI